jgi:hypothetical protein
MTITAQATWSQSEQATVSEGWLWEQGWYQSDKQHKENLV